MQYSGFQATYLSKYSDISLKFTTLLHQIAIFLLGICIVGIGIWLAAWTQDLTAVGQIQYSIQLYPASYGLFIIAGGLLLIFPIIGCSGSQQENTTLLLIYLILLIFTTFILLTCGILGLVWGQQVRDTFATDLGTAIRYYYGVGMSVGRNVELTNAVDQLQKSFGCCGANGTQSDLTSWFIYRNISAWYQEQTKGSGAPFVPLSCCTRDSKGDVLNANVCQGNKSYDQAGGNSRVAPIWTPPLSDTVRNPYLYHTGCATAMMETMNYYSRLLGGISLGCVVFMIIGIILTCCLLRSIEVAKMAFRSVPQQQTFVPAGWEAATSGHKSGQTGTHDGVAPTSHMGYANHAMTGDAALNPYELARARREGRQADSLPRPRARQA